MLLSEAHPSYGHARTATVIIVFSLSGKSELYLPVVATLSAETVKGRKWPAGLRAEMAQRHRLMVFK